MSSLSRKINQFLINIRTIDIQTKYKALTIGIALVHLVFTICFAFEHIKFLFWYNLAVTIFYFYQSAVSIRDGKYVFVYVTTMVEILFHVVVASLMLGWDWGFAMYTMSMIPASFYLTYTLPQVKGKTSVAIWTSTLIAMCFIAVRAICEMSDPLYQGYRSELMRICMYYFNIVIALIVLVVFSSFFAMEIIYMQKQLEQENHRLEEIANFDPLTRLLNRRSMNGKLQIMQQEALQQRKSFCVLLVDIDDFKKVNDTHGHDCGDEVLVAVSGLIMNDVREGDAVCRWGGEEILVLLKADLEAARKVAWRICKDVRKMVVNCNGTEVGVTLTIGVAEYKNEQTIHSLIEEADRNMYYGKHHGKNQVVTTLERGEE